MKEESVKKWYQKLQFPTACDVQFYNALEQIEEDTLNALTLDFLKEEQNWIWNLFYLLSHYETMHEAHSARGIPDAMINACGQEIVTTVHQRYERCGMVGVSAVGHFDKMVRLQKMFPIGRLIFDMEKGDTAVANRCSGGPIREGENIILIHIPSRGKLITEECIAAIKIADTFFPAYFPEFEYRYYVFASWLMYEGLDEFLGEKSNIREFRKLFEPYRTVEDESGLHYAFSDTTTRENIKEYEPQNSFQKKLKEHILNGGKLYKSYGFRERRVSKV